MEKTETVKFFPKRKWDIPRKFIVITRPLCNREYAKLRQWLDNHEHIVIFTDSKRKVWLMNQTQVEIWQNRKRK